MKIIGIVAVGKSLEIGKAGALPWKYSSDLSFFKETTTGNAVVMGFNTWLSIGKALPGRLNVVLSGSRKIDVDGVVTCSTVDGVIRSAENYGADLFVIGGSQTYKTFNGLIDQWIVTRIPEEIPDADAFMEEDFLADFEKESELELSDGLQVEFFKRKKA